jgi:outer membrane receptor protein involved in Fe transport
MGNYTAGYTDRNYFILDLGAQYKVNKNLKLFINALNVTNARYQEIGNQYDVQYENKNVSGGYDYTPVELVGEAWFPMPSRTIMVGAEYTF